MLINEDKINKLGVICLNKGYITENELSTTNRMKSMLEDYKVNEDIDLSDWWEYSTNSLLTNIFELSVLNKKNGKYEIVYKTLVNKLYQNMMDYFNDHKTVLKQLKNLLSFFLSCYSKDAVDLYLKTDYKNKTGETNKYWCLTISYIFYSQIPESASTFCTNIYTKKPEDWVYISENTAITGNGENRCLLTNGLYYLNNFVKSIWNEDVINKINISQKVGYYIDTDLFYKVISNDFDVLNIKKYKDFIEVGNWDDYSKYILDNYFDYKRYNGKTINILKDLEKSYNDDEKYVVDIHKKNIILYLLTCCIYELKNNDKKYIHHYISLCYRGRQIYKGMFNPIFSTIIREFIIFQKINDKAKINKWFIFHFSNSIEKCDNFEKSKTIYNKYKNQVIKIEINKINKPITFLKLNQNQNSTISLDASSSMLQIISVLIKDYKLMYYSNVLKNNRKLDVYDYIISILTDEKKRILPKIFKSFYTNRKIVKYTIMTYVYGSQPLYIANAIIEKFNITGFIKIDLVTMISKIIQVFNNEFKSVKMLKKIVRKYITKKDKDWISITSINKTIKYQIPKIKETKFTVKARQQLINTNILTIKKGVYDDNKKRRSCLVNIIHSLDSDVCLNTRSELIKNGVNCISIHDSFVVNINNYETTVIEYNKNMLKVYNHSIFKCLPDLSLLTNNDKKLKKIIDEMYETSDKSYSWLKYEKKYDVDNVENSILNSEFSIS